MAGLSGADVAGYYYEGAGNRFILLDGILGMLPEGGSNYARRRCQLDPFKPDGVLLVDRDPQGALRLVIFNRDGSRPETCGNGLRCAGWHAHHMGHQVASQFSIQTDAGEVPVRVETDPSGQVSVAVSMGPVSVLGEQSMPSPHAHLSAFGVDCGNPHLVLPDAPLTDQAVAELGPLLEGDPRFPEGTNVEFLQRNRSGGLSARVWERGVGETEACGSGACACAAVAVSLGWADWPVQISLPGGDLVISQHVGGRLWLRGEVALMGELGSAPA